MNKFAFSSLLDFPIREKFWRILIKFFNKGSHTFLRRKHIKHVIIPSRAFLIYLTTCLKWTFKFIIYVLLLYKPVTSSGCPLSHWNSSLSEWTAGNLIHSPLLFYSLSGRRSCSCRGCGHSTKGLGELRLSLSLDWRDPGAYLVWCSLTFSRHWNEAQLLEIPRQYPSSRDTRVWKRPQHCY